MSTQYIKMKIACLLYWSAGSLPAHAGERLALQKYICTAYYEGMVKPAVCHLDGEKWVRYAPVYVRK